MDAGVIQRILSRLLWFTVISLVVPAIVGIAYQDERWWAFAIPAAAAAIAARVFARLPAAVASEGRPLRRREGFLAVVLGWLILVLHTAVAFRITGAFPGFAEAWFESMSGFTTTGASVITDIEDLPKAVLFQRSFSHWIGGMGIIVLSVAILPELGVGGMQLFAAESSGLEAEKLAPRIAATARRLWILYAGITALLAVLLLPAMSGFDAVNHAMSTVATGGFSTKNASIGQFGSLYIEMVILVFMFIAGISFALQYRAFIQRQPERLWRSPEVRLYLALTVAATGLITLSLWSSTSRDFATSLRHASFHTVSVISTTGFGTSDFDAWPHVCRLLLLGLMVIGGCAGSTAGGSKVVRLHVVIAHAVTQLRRLVRPRLVQTIRLGDHVVTRETTEGVLGFYLLFFAASMAGALVMTALGMDLVSGATASVSAMSSVGPGLGTVGVTHSYGHVQEGGLYLLSFGMLLGRLEIYTVLVLFTAHFWRRG